MIVTGRARRLPTLEQVRALLDASEVRDIEVRPREAAYASVAETLARFGEWQVAHRQHRPERVPLAPPRDRRARGAMPCAGLRSASTLSGA